MKNNRTYINKLIKNKHQSSVFYILLFPIILNFISNIVNKNINNLFIKFNLYDIFSSLLIFTFLLIVGDIVKSVFNLRSRIFGIIIFLTSFFLLDIHLLFFIKSLTFENIYYLNLTLWSLLLIIRKENIELSKIFLAMLNLLLIKINNSIFFDFLTKNKNLIGDVEAVFLKQSSNIYEYSYKYSIINYADEGYPQFTSYVQSLIHKISFNTESFIFVTSTSQVIFYLSILFFCESKISRFGKIYVSLIYTFLIINNEFYQFLFTSSLMSEGIVNLFTAVILYELALSIQGKNQKLIYFFFLGVLYLTKQFISTISIILSLFFIFKKDSRKLALISIYPLVLKELLLFTSFKNINSSHHLNQINVKDTFFDLITFSNLEFGNILIIFNNLYKDKPFILLVFVLFLVLIFNLIKHKKIDFLSQIFMFVILSNIFLTLCIYISAWKNMELESPVRFILTYFHLYIITIFINIEKLKQKN